LMLTAAENTDGSIAVVVLNMEEAPKYLKIKLGEKSTNLRIIEKAVQTIIIEKENKS
jgi:glucosylceramidase